jgi:proline utilization trans-activator
MAPSTLAPELASTPWFIDMAVPNTPILLAEASDSAFATRFRQAISGSEHSHIPRVNYPAEDQLLGLSDAACLGRWHHIVRGSVILDELEEGLQYPKSMGALLQSKFWVLFAIGKMYSTRTSVAPKCFPGLEYFAKATKILRFISERPTVEMVETWLLLVCYHLGCSYALLALIPPSSLSILSV